MGPEPPFSRSSTLDCGDAEGLPEYGLSVERASGNKAARVALPIQPMSRGGYLVRFGITRCLNKQARRMSLSVWFPPAGRPTIGSKRNFEEHSVRKVSAAMRV